MCNGLYRGQTWEIFNDSLWRSLKRTSCTSQNSIFYFYMSNFQIFDSFQNTVLCIYMLYTLSIFNDISDVDVKWVFQMLVIKMLWYGMCEMLRCRRNTKRDFVFIQTDIVKEYIICFLAYSCNHGLQWVAKIDWIHLAYEHDSHLHGWVSCTY